MSELKVGDVVVLNSGSPAMTVINVGQHSVECAWSYEGDIRMGVVPIAALRAQSSVRMENAAENARRKGQTPRKRRAAKIAKAKE